MISREMGHRAEWSIERRLRRPHPPRTAEHDVTLTKRTETIVLASVAGHVVLARVRLPTVYT